MSLSVTRGGLFRSLPAVAVAAAVLAIGLGSPETISAAEDKRPIEGVWEGRYVCAQGPTGATLTIKALPHWPGIQVYLHRLLMGWLANPETRVPEAQPKQLQIDARFRFYALPDNPGVPSGEFELSGTFDPELGVLNLYPSQWIEQPEGYNWAGLKALLENEGESLTGALDLQGCGVVALRRAGARTAQPDQSRQSADAPALSRESDAVLMDLRGFLPDNQGCVFEINELLNVVPLDRVVFVVDATTDLAFLRETFATGWEALAAESPTTIWWTPAFSCSNLPARRACPD